MISRNETKYVNEPYVTGGNPILADKNVLFNDMLGTTLGIKTEKYESIDRDAFGMVAMADTTPNLKEDFFTGKPYIGELGYAFLFRNYRADQGKWQTQDPLGYPDEWNNLAYCNNWVISFVDILGGWRLNLVGFSDSQRNMFNQYFNKTIETFQQRVKEINRYLDVAGGCVGCSSGCKCSEANPSNYLGMTRIKEIPDTTLAGINSSTIMTVRLEDMGNSVHGSITDPNSSDPLTLRLNINERYNFFSGEQGALKTLFHELSHQGGSLDEYGAAWWLDAATLEMLAVGDVRKIYSKYMDCICE